MTTTTIRIDGNVKKDANKLAKGIGFSFSDLVNVLLRKAIREGGVDLRHDSFKTKVVKSRTKNPAAIRRERR